MVCRTIEYTDYLGNKRKEDFYFHLNKADIIKLMATEGDYTLDKVLEKIGKERNGKKALEFIDQLIYMSYGERSIDGRQFKRTKEVKEAFLETEAYSILFSELVSSAEAAAKFVTEIIPAEMVDAITEAIRENPDGIPAEVKDLIPKTLTEHSNPAVAQNA